MKLFIYKYPFYLSMFLLNLLSLMINNWFMMWMLMELNLMMFIPLMNEKKNIKMSSKISLKYFLIQSLSSMFILLSILMNLMLSNIMNMNLILLIMMMMLFMKLGMYPLHMWFIKIMSQLNWNNCFILSTIQKLIPFMIMMNMIYKNKSMFLIFNILNTIMSTIGGLNQTMIKLIFAYSSINHMSWMMIIKITMEKMFYFYLTIYLLMNFSMMMMMKYLNMKSINKIFNSNYNFYTKICIFINFLSLGGIPPMIGFLIKWMSIYCLKINSALIFNFSVLMITSTITIIYYLYSLLPTIMYFSFKMKMNNYKLSLKKSNTIYLLMMYMMLTTLMFNNFIN